MSSSQNDHAALAAEPITQTSASSSSAHAATTSPAVQIPAILLGIAIAVAFLGAAVANAF